MALRELSPYNGLRRWAVDQLANPDSTALQHEGMYSGNVLFYGRVDTASKSPVALLLQRAFESCIKKHFVRIKAFYVGRQAEQLLNAGHRITVAAQTPRENDLRR